MLDEHALNERQQKPRTHTHTHAIRKTSLHVACVMLHTAKTRCWPCTLQFYQGCFAVACLPLTQSGMRCSEGGPHFAACRWGAGCTLSTHVFFLTLLCFALFFAPAFSLLTLLRQWSCQIAGQDFCASIFITSSTLLHWCMSIVRCWGFFY